ncbi:MAG: hypothetical protein AMS27_12700 [Bacteroides sp. SM23_62_1]|nr:MAG: hypothetical protein AMS27_12700 [Bacteroides sp. SM23_62_1]
MFTNQLIEKTFLFFVILIIGYSGCQKFEKRPAQQPLARVGEKYLYTSDVQDIFPNNLPENDSILILNNFVDKWIKKQLLLQKAELNLSDEQKDVSKQLDEYRSSLLIFKYEQSLIKQKLDTIIYPSEIEEYYAENSSNFLLDNTIVKALFIKLPADAPNLNRLRQLYRSEDEDDMQQLESYCYQYANKYDYFNDQWIPFSMIQSELPQEINNPDRFLVYNKYIEQQDSTYKYFVYLRDYRAVSEQAPIEYIENNIKSIILNKRKVQFLNDMENDIYNDAIKKGDFTIY